MSILSLQPGVVLHREKRESGRRQPRRFRGGARSDQTNVTLDGLDDNDQLSGNAFQGAMRAPLDSFRNFASPPATRTQMLGDPPERRSSLVTKSGTNNFPRIAVRIQPLQHWPEPTTGSTSRPELNAGLPNMPGSLFATRLDVAVGGPIKKDRLFFFAAYEGQRTTRSAADNTHHSER